MTDAILVVQNDSRRPKQVSFDTNDFSLFCDGVNRIRVSISQTQVESLRQKKHCLASCRVGCPTRTLATRVRTYVCGDLHTLTTTTALQLVQG